MFALKCTKTKATAKESTVPPNDAAAAMLISNAITYFETVCTEEAILCRMEAPRPPPAPIFTPASYPFTSPPLSGARRARGDESNVGAAGGGTKRDTTTPA